jgi:hypothetical protein
VPFRFNMLLEEAGIGPAEVRLLRHQPKVAGRSMVDIWRSDRAAIEGYQALQPVSKRAHFLRPYWASFIGTWDGRTLFSGLYSVGVPEAVTEPVVVPITGALEEPGVSERYPTARLEALKAYEGRLYIDWGGGSSGKRAWVQRAEAQNKLVTELHLDTAEQPFPGLMELSSSLSGLADVPPSWIQRLSAAKGVYLLTCPRDGSLYVGSATAEGGFWARWENYRSNRHGGNEGLIGREPSDFIVSILQVAGSADTDETILAMESRWKTKLQSRERGLNRN